MGKNNAEARIRVQALNHQHVGARSNAHECIDRIEQEIRQSRKSLSGSTLLVPNTIKDGEHFS